MFNHYSVMLTEAIKLLDIKPDGIYVDMTLGGAGHSQAIYQQLNKSGLLICFDQDQLAIDNAQKIFKNKENVIIIKANFSQLKQELEKLNIEKVDGFIFDLGVSSMQLDEKERGFSYRFDYRLDMRMNQDQEYSAYDLVNQASFNDLVYYLSRYGEEKFAKQIARNIEKKRQDKPIETTFELVEIIKQSLPQAVLKKQGHPAKKTFQAIRIAVNNELEVFEQALYQAVDLLNVNGRIVVITFHSLEDRLCKQIFKEYTTSKLPKQIIAEDDVKYRLINSKVIVASEEELNENRRSKPSKMRAIERVKL